MVHLGEIRLECEGCRVARVRLRIAPQLVQHKCKLAMRVGKRRVALNRGAVALDRALEITVQFVDISDKEPCRGGLRLDRKRTPACCIRLRMTPEPGKRSAQAKVGGGQVWREVRRELETVYGIFEVLLLEIHKSKIMVRLCRNRV